MKNPIVTKSTMCILATLGGILASNSLAGAQTILFDNNDAAVATDQGNVWSAGNWELWIGGMSWNGNEASVVLPFKLPSLGAVTDPFSSATLGLTYMNINGTPAGNADLYGLGVRASGTVLSGDYYSGALDGTAGVTLLENNIITPSTSMTSADQPNNVFSTDLAGYLNTAYAGGVNAGQYVLLRLSYDISGNTSDCYHIEANAGNGSPADWPQIAYSLAPAPEPSPIALCGLAGLMGVITIYRHR